MTIVVTGGTGMIGSRLVEALRASYPDAQVRAVPHGPSADLEDAACAARHLHDADWIVHCAANYGGAEYLGSAAGLQIPARNLRIDTAVALAAAAGSCRRLLFTSSACVYPDRPNLLRENDAWQGIPGVGAYGMAKLTSESIFREVLLGKALVQVARLDTTYGWPCHWQDKRAKAPAAMCRKLARCVHGRAAAVELLGTGSEYRTFMHVDDAVRGIMALLRQPEVPVCNFAGGEYMQIRDWMRLLQWEAGTAFPVTFSGTPATAKHRHVDTCTAQLCLGWKPQVAAGDGLRDLYTSILQEQTR